MLRGCLATLWGLNKVNTDESRMKQWREPIFWVHWLSIWKQPSPKITICLAFLLHESMLSFFFDNLWFYLLLTFYHMLCGKCQFCLSKQVSKQRKFVLTACMKRTNICFIFHVNTCMLSNKTGLKRLRFLKRDSALTISPVFNIGCCPSFLLKANFTPDRNLVLQLYPLSV